jgi:competence protein ComGC
MDNETPAKRTNDPAATISLVFGLLAIVFVVLGSLPFRVVQFNTMPLGLCSIFFAIFAIFFGQQALRRISAAKQTQGGRWRAISGLIIGYLWLGVVVFSIVSALSRSMIEGHRLSKSSACQNNIRAIILAYQTYAVAHQHQLPPDLDTLQKAGLLDAQRLTCPNQKDKTAKASSYLYFGAGLKLEDLDGKTILIAERDRVHWCDGKHTWFNLGFGDCHLVPVTDPGDLATIARSHGWKLPGAEKNATSGTNATHATSGTPQAKP